MQWTCPLLEWFHYLHVRYLNTHFNYFCFTENNKVEPLILSRKRKTEENRKQLAEKRSRKILVEESLQNYDKENEKPKLSIPRHFDIAVQTNFPDGNCISYCGMLLQAK